MAKDSVYRSVAEYAALPFNFAACMLVGALIGYGLDKLFGTTLLWLVFLILGIAAGVVQLIRQLSKDSGDAPRG